VVARDPGRAPSEADLLDISRKRLSGLKIPQHIEFVSSLPRTASGKILHRNTDPGGQASRDERPVGVQ
jgi:acyl-coenzyme A synthetase/AMP-(fatty) acid ligase